MRCKLLKSVRIATCGFILILIGTLISCGFARGETTAKLSDTKELIGTFVSISVFDDDEVNSKKALEKAFSRAFELEQIFSVTIEDSELSAVNRFAFQNEIAVSDELFFVLKNSLLISERSNNAFDIAAGKLVALWGVGTEDARLPTPAEVDKAKGTNSVEDIVLDENKKTIKISNDVASVNLGAICKGYFADEIKKVLLECGIKSALIDLGGNILTVGLKPNGALWKIGVTDPFDTAKIVGIIEVDNLSVVTSGNYEKFFEKNGVRYHHIFDTKFGYPAESGVAGVTIVGENSMFCDGLSTAVFVMGVEKGLELIENFAGYEALFIAENGEVLTSSGFKKFNFRKG